MKRSLYILITALAVIMTATGCIRRDAIRFNGITDMNVSLQTSPRVDAVLLVENTSGYNVSIRDIAFNVTDKQGNLIGKVIVTQELSLPKRSETQLLVPLKISITNPLKGLALLTNIERNASTLFVSGSATVKAGWMKKTIRVENISLAEFTNYLKGTFPAEKVLHVAESDIEL